MHKLILEGYPCFTIGSVDKNKKYHPFGFGIAVKEEGIDFEFMFRAVQETALVVHKIDYKPTVLIADDAQ